MSTYITSTDWSKFIRVEKLNQIIDGDTDLQDQAERFAIQKVTDALHPYYDIDAIFAKTGTNRDDNVLEWVMCLSLYNLYRRVPDKSVPQRVVDDYEKTVDMLSEISDGKLSIDLDRKLNTDSEPFTKFRWGSEPKRRHD